MITVRERAARDVDECVELLELVYQRDGYPVQGTANAVSFLTGESTWRAWVAEEQGRIVGHIAVSSPSNDDLAVALHRSIYGNQAIAVLERLFVHPTARGCGAASALMQTAQSYGASKGQRLVLFALIKDRNAIRLYERLGWRNFGTALYNYGNGKQMDAICFCTPQLQADVGIPPGESTAAVVQL
ncbi:hypothetical protein BAUCODRAFT_77041 [Baudoinia panamericana UAMH 10762]|uniref:N-acetyltransferase domain-containing protein n=1 Tax=Baudoinia panamericana (strain UAMH 10762) TaxID=717646 RepID=M2LFG5_BAUPA|nr:uncharacterized protein BAUCODRAFT_77041 [Baudoinia panamericana UAMH 10762]EMC92782.1 hypothetical protein BAUCODRAFT_77041 [Baudoinia panamericana UAMH 10762]